MYQEAVFQLSDGSRFKIMHNLPETGPDSIGSAFDYFTADVYKGKTEYAQVEFINYLNRHGVKRAMTKSQYDIMQTTPAPGEFGDNSEMPFGKHKGKKMCQISGFYLIYIYDNNMIYDERVKKYIIEREAELRKEAGKK